MSPKKRQRERDNVASRLIPKIGLTVPQQHLSNVERDRDLMKTEALLSQALNRVQQQESIREGDKR